MLHQIGAGTLGPVFRAYDATRERLVAVKLFKLDLPPERTHQLVAELERLIAADLAHPALATPLATGISGVSAFLAQDYVAADSLDLAVREYGPAPVGNALRVAAQLAGALDFAAAVQITHGALHPRDVLLSSDDTRLTGLGISRALERIGVVAPVRRPYSAPERIAGGEWDRRADQFSLAALIHELMWGRRVSGVGVRAAESLTAIDGTRLAALQEVFARALAENAADRYETALEFAEALKDACPDVAVASVAAPVPPPKSRAVRDEEPRLPLDEALEGEATIAQTIDRSLQLWDMNEPPATTAAHDVSTAQIDIVAPVDAEPDMRYSPAEQILHESTLAETLSVSPPGFITGRDSDSFSALERTRSAVWPLVLALVVGIGIGFAGGFFAGSREQPPATNSASATAQRQFSESAVLPPPAPPKVEDRSQKSEVEAGKTQVAGRKSELEARKSEASNLKSEISNLKSPEAEGRLLVRSRPAGAQVTVDGKAYGPTPATVRGLGRGAHRVKITHDGYAAEDRRFVVTSSRPERSITVALEPVRAAAASRGQAPISTQGRFVGALAIDSRPAGAKVFMDGTLVGTTPMALPTVPVGSHAIRLEHDGYRRWSSSVRIVASEQKRVTASLER